MKAIEIVTKSSLVHVIAREFNTNVLFLDRRWWELRPRMQVTIPVKDDEHMIRVQKRVLHEVVLRGYSPGIHMRMENVETRNA